MKILVTGAAGQLGHDECHVLFQRGFEYIGVGRADFDITDRESTQAFLENYQPDAVIHCAAYTKVDLAEDEPDQCMRVNAEGSRNVALACRACGAKMMYISTDYVFPGTGCAPWETDDPTGPLNVYGRTKLAGEQAVRELVEKHFIVRTSWVIGAHGKKFVKTMLRLAETHDRLRVVDDQIGSPTFTADLAPLLCEIIETEQYGVYHATNEGFCSWAALAEAVFRLAGKSVAVERVSTEAYGAKALRPKNSRLSKASLDAGCFKRLPAWEDSLAKMLEKEMSE